MRLIHRYALLSIVVVLVTSCLLLIDVVKNRLVEKSRILEPSFTHIIKHTNATRTESSCRFHSCFNLFQCKHAQDWKIKVYVYPLGSYVTKNGRSVVRELSYEFESILLAFQNSAYITSNISEACLLVPAVDLLSEKGLDLSLVSTALNSLPSWKDGENHVIFNFFPELPLPRRSVMHTQVGKAFIASSNLLYSNKRHGFDISIPLFNSFTAVSDVKRHRISIGTSRRWKLIVSQLSVDSDQRDSLRKVEDSEGGVLMLRKCLGTPSNTIHHNKLCKDGLPFTYPNILKDGWFCLILPGMYHGTTLLLDAMMLGCVPVIAMDDYVLPFNDVIDWNRASIRINEYQIKNVMKILAKFGKDEIKQKQYQAFYLWKRYFSSIDLIVNTMLDLLNERVFVRTKQSYEEWNGPFGSIHGDKLKPGAPLPLYLPLLPGKDKGFTAVILTYNRVDMLFLLMKALDKVPSLAKLIVVWNNPYSHPHPNNWPVLDKPWTLIQTKTNRLTNRFYPFKEIETEAVMAIDDDILMLTTDEIEFAYQTWREFPDRLVGFPARVHITDPNDVINGKRMKYKYESEWQNELSMVLTGAAFYHKMYNHWFTYMLPFKTRDYIDEKMNCEDIGMNFLISNLTGKAPIKVSPRKRFKCAQCRGNDSLWSETSHFIKRSECLRVFTNHFGGKMPLEAVEYRVDPVLFQEAVPQEMKAFPDIGMV